MWSVGQSGKDLVNYQVVKLLYQVNLMISIPNSSVPVGMPFPMIFHVISEIFKRSSTRNGQLVGQCHPGKVTFCLLEAPPRRQCYSFVFSGENYITKHMRGGMKTEEHKRRGKVERFRISSGEIYGPISPTILASWAQVCCLGLIIDQR